MDAIVFEESESESQAEKSVRFMTSVITFLTEMQTVVRDLKLVGTSRMGPNNKRVVTAYTKLQNKHSPYEDVVKGARDFRNWLANLPLVEAEMEEHRCESLTLIRLIRTAC